MLMRWRDISPFAAPEVVLRSLGEFCPGACEHLEVLTEIQAQAKFIGKQQ